MRYFSILLSTLFIFASGIQVMAQESDDAAPERAMDSYYHQKGSHVLNLGAGLLTNPTQFSFDLFSGGSGSGQPSPAVNLSYEYGLSSQISIGALLGYYRVDAQQDISIEDLLSSDFLDDPICLAECLLPISLGGSCDCGSKSVEERINVFTVAGKFSYHFFKLCSYLYLLCKCWGKVLFQS